MSKILMSYFIVAGTMVVLDAVWLGLVAPSFYKKHIGHLMSTQPNWIAAGLFYLLFIAGLMFFVVYPLRESATLLKVGLSGALFGLITYATYDLTNNATLKDWPVIVTIVDMLWGSVLTAGVSTASVAILRGLHLV